VSKGAEHIGVEVTMEVVLGDVFEWLELIDAGIVDENIDPAERLLGLFEQPAHVRRLGDVGLHRNGLAAFGRDRGRNAVGALLVGRIIDHHGGACRRQGFGGRGADALGGARDHRDFSFEIAHRSLSLRIAVWRQFHNSIIIELLMSVELWCGAVNRKGERN